MSTLLKKLSASGLERFVALKSEAIDAVTERCFSTHGTIYDQFVARGREACRQDLALHLEFAETVLELGVVEPMVDYLHWLAGLLSARLIPSQQLVQSLDWLAAFYVKRTNVDDAAIIVAAFSAVLDGFLTRTDSVLSIAMPPEPWPVAAPFESALLQGNVGEAHAIVNDCLDAGSDLVAIEMHVVQPSLYNIGRGWETNVVTIAQERLATSIAQSVMTAGLLRTAPAPEKGKRALLACVEGNNHDVGLRIVADAFALDGWEVQFLGANVPTDALLRQAQRSHPELIALSLSLPQQFRTARSAIAKLREALRERPPCIIIGGLAINRFTMLASLAGADAYCSEPRAAVKFAALKALDGGGEAERRTG